MGMIALLRPYRRERIWSLTTDAQTRPLPMIFSGCASVNAETMAGSHLSSMLKTKI